MTAAKVAVSVLLSSATPRQAGWSASCGASGKGV
jgi:hypothetical protein